MMRIDIDNVLRLRVPRYHRRIPRFMIRWLERIIHQDGLNQLLSHNAGTEGVDFAAGVTADLGVNYRIERDSSMAPARRVIFVSNHPLGGLDGLILAQVIRDLYGGDKKMKFIVNDLLTFVEPLKSIFIGVNKHGEQSRESALALDEAFAGDTPVVMFPAGLVSRRMPDGSIADLQWHKMVVNKAIYYHRDIIPLHFSGENSSFFYKFAQLRTRLGLKFNIEMIRLPAEIFRQSGHTFTVTVGKPIGWETLRGGKDAQNQADSLRELVYRLKKAD
ncbi:MAG: glycerol acyltransferase [Muribaculaceae bacterium]|nr:glycerol acyltransferase [Muribaculaceae bacterium]